MDRKEARDWVLKGAKALQENPDRWTAGIFCEEGPDGRAVYCVYGAAAMLSLKGTPFTQDQLHARACELQDVDPDEVGERVCEASNAARPGPDFVERIRKALDQ